MVWSTDPLEQAWSYERESATLSFAGEDRIVLRSATAIEVHAAATGKLLARREIAVEPDRIEVASLDRRNLVAFTVDDTSFAVEIADLDGAGSARGRTSAG